MLGAKVFPLKHDPKKSTRLNSESKSKPWVFKSSIAIDKHIEESKPVALQFLRLKDPATTQILNRARANGSIHDHTPSL